MQIIRRRKKKKKLNEIELCQDIDSGYLNGPESSSELTSETELLTGKTFVTNFYWKEKGKGNLSRLFTDEDRKPKKDISTENSPSTIEFGDVKEILEELAIAKTFHHQISEPTENIQEVTEFELRNNQQSQLKPELEKKVPKEEDFNSELDSRSISQLISQENGKRETFEVENNHKLSVKATLSEESKIEALFSSGKPTRNEKSTKSNNNARTEQKGNAKEVKTSHLKGQMSNHGNAIAEGTLPKLTFTIFLRESFFLGDLCEARNDHDIPETGMKVNIPETWTKVKKTKKNNKAKGVSRSSKKKLGTVEKQQKAGSENHFSKIENEEVPNKNACRSVEFITTLT